MRPRSRIMRRLSEAQRVVITPQRTWRARLLWSAAFVFALLLFFWLSVDFGRHLALDGRQDPEQVHALRTRLETLQQERDRLSAQLDTIESRAQIERTTQTELAEQIKILGGENQKLKDELAFFESVVSPAGGPGGVFIPRVVAEIAGPGQLRYRILVMQKGKVTQDFNGELQLNLALVQGGKPAIMQFPDGRQGEATPLKLSFRHYQRLEGVIALPENATVRSIQAKVLEKGTLRAQQQANL